MYLEQSVNTKYLNENGIEENDIVVVRPASGKRFEFKINRTQIDFVSDSLFSSIDSVCKKKIVGVKNENIHLRLSMIKGKNSINEIVIRYQLMVISGPAFKLNGNWVLKALLEKNDICEIGYNEIQFIESKEEDCSNFIESLLKKHKNIIQSDLPMMLIGETGVGKTSLAKKIHDRSNAKGEFVHLNISSFSHNLIESELFGHVKGAFTSAVTDKKGAFREAQEGTLFLDEIDSLPWELQTKLLVFLDNYCARAVGGQRDYHVKTRLIFASGRKLTSLVEKGEMRKDFYFRIAFGQSLKLDSLRDRPELIGEFCDKFAKEHSLVIDKKLKEFYMTLPWAGNYRQLKGHLIQKSVISKFRKFQFDEVDESLIEQSSHLEDIHESILPMKEFKKVYAQKVFLKCDKNYTKAAHLLSISTRSLKTILESPKIMRQQ